MKKEQRTATCTIEDILYHLLNLWDHNEIAPHYAAEGQIIQDIFEEIRAFLITKKKRKKGGHHG